MNLTQCKKDFPVLNKPVNGKPIVYLDSACMSLRPLQVIKKLNEYYVEYPGCAGRSAHRIASQVNREVELARKEIAKYIGAKHKEEIIFTKNTTESINLVANTLKPKTVVISDREHNSNLVPWLNNKVELRVCKSNSDGSFNLDNLKEIIQGADIVSVVYTSNLDGYTLPVKEIIKIAHKEGVLVLLDAAQAAPHKEIDVRSLDVDFLAFSGHKMCGPSGIGVLYGKKALLEKLPQFIVGGDTVESTTYTSFKPLPLPEKYEAGLQHYAGIIGLGEACRYISKIGRKNIERHEIELANYIKEQIKDIPGITIIHPTLQTGIVSFYHSKIDMHDLAIMLDESENICVRSGQHCVHSWFAGKNLKGSVRASLYFYNDKADADVFVKALRNVVELLG